MTTTIRFGTEGWRAVMADEFTVDNVRLVTQAIAGHVARAGRRGARTDAPARRAAPPGRVGRTAPCTVAVGYDTRFLSGFFARAICEVLAGNGLRSVLSAGPVPTCAVSRYVAAKRLSAGIMVTASHNPAIYNGVKVKESSGGSATSETVASIERRLGRSAVRRVPFNEAAEAGMVRPAPMLPLFLQGIRSFLDMATIRRARLRVIVDSMHGAGGALIEGLLKGGRCRVETLHANPDPLFGGHAPEPIAAHLGELAARVRQTRADLGIANDGDADRLGIIGPGGVWLNPGQVMCVLLLHLVQARRAAGAVVKTVSNTMMINRLAQALGLRLIEVPVGFKHIAKLMLTEDILIGGEESGGIGVKGYLPERDGILAGLLVLEALAVRRRSLASILRDLERQCGRWWYGRCDQHGSMAQVDRLFRRLQAAAPTAMAGIPVAQVSTLDGVKLIGRDESWLLFRRSGTEPIVRIYAETPRQDRLARLLGFGVGLLRSR
jgi:phosphomannomutase